MTSIRRKVVSETKAYGRRGGEYRLLTLECGHTVERHWKRIYRSQEEECPRCSTPQFFIRELGLSPTHEAALRRLYRDGQVGKKDVSGTEARAMSALVAKGFAVEVEQPDGAYFKVRNQHGEDE